MTNLIPAVQLVDGHPRVSSLSISDHFKKRHADVINSVRKITLECPPEFSERNFSLAEFMDEQGKPRPMYQLSRDGFTLVAMGFTGKRALEWKVRYIEAFNAMERALIEDDHGQPLTLTPSTVADRKPLNDLVQIWVDAAPITKRQAWEMIHAHFCIASIKDFTVEELEIVMDFVQARIDALPKSLPEAAHAEAPALKYPLHDFKQAEDVNRALVSKTMRLAMDWSQQLRKLADEAGDAFNHTERRGNIMGLLDSTVYSHKEAIKRLSTAVGESVLAIAAQHEALMQLAQLMRRQEKM